MRRVELSAAGVHPETLTRLVQEGTLTRFTRGLYQLGDADITASHELAEVAKLAPKGVICLVSALQFHELTLQMPSRVWLAIGTKARPPKIDYPPIRVVRFGKQALSLGVEIPNRRRVGPHIQPGRDSCRLLSVQKACPCGNRGPSHTRFNKASRLRSFGPRYPDLVGSEALSAAVVAGGA